MYAGHVGEDTGELDAGRPGPYDDEGQERRAQRRIGLALGTLESKQDAPRIVVASSSVFRPGANGSHSSCPK